jgi:hypothetical protein
MRKRANHPSRWAYRVVSNDALIQTIATSGGRAGAILAATRIRGNAIRDAWVAARFEAIPDPCGRYEIWNSADGAPVLHHDRLLSYAQKRQAERVAALLNAAAGRTTRRPTRARAG